MRFADRREHLDHQLQALPHGQALGVAVNVDRLAFDQLHDEVGVAVRARPAVEQAGDRRMVEAGEDLPFGLEAGHDLGGFETAGAA